MSVITSEVVPPLHMTNESRAAVRELHADLYALLGESNEGSFSTEQRLGEVLRQHTSAISVFRYSADDHETPVTVWASQLQDVPSNVMSWCVGLANRCLVEGCAKTEASQDTGQAVYQLSAVPIEGVDGQCVLAFHQSTDTPFVEQALTSAAIAVVRARSENLSIARQLAALQDLVARIEAAESREEAANTICENLAGYLGVTQVVVALADESSRFRIVAASGQDQIDESRESNRLAKALMQEAACRNEISVWPTNGQSKHALLCHRQYAQFQGHAIAIGCPLFDSQRKLRGAILLSHEDQIGPHVMPFLQSSQRPIATALHLIHRAEQTRFVRKLRSLFSAAQRNRLVAALCCAGLLAATLCIPVRYTVKAPCKLEPTNKRYLAAPFSGKLLECFVTPGDAVEENQLLARLDGQETEWELASITAELQRAIKERAGYVAEHESGKARLTHHEIEYLRSKQRLLMERVSQLEVRSPVSGLVVSGDLTKAEGVPLEIGQSLFEIAPLQSMVAEIAVPEDDVRFVSDRLTVRIHFDAFPFDPFETQLSHVRPRAEIRDDENVFVADANVENSRGNLRPGMDGIARIKTDRHPIGWVLFHKPVAAAVQWLGL